MKRIVPVLVAVVMLIGSAFAETGSQQMYVLCRPDDYVNARYSPSTKSDVMGRLCCGETVSTDGETKIDKQGRKWIKIYGFESGEAWVCAMYLQHTPITVEQCTGYVVAKGRTALRRSPNGKRIKWLENGDEISILAMSDEWALTTRGYVKRECLDVNYHD